MMTNIEGQHQSFSWEPPVGVVLSPGFKATMDALSETVGSPTLGSAQVSITRKFIDNLERRGYCIALLPIEENTAAH